MVKSRQLCSLFVHFLIIAHDMPLSKNKPTGHLQEEAARLMRATSSRSVSVSVSSSYRSYGRGTTVSLFYVIATPNTYPFGYSLLLFLYTHLS